MRLLPSRLSWRDRHSIRRQYDFLPMVLHVRLTPFGRMTASVVRYAPEAIGTAAAAAQDAEVTEWLDHLGSVRASAGRSDWQRGWTHGNEVHTWNADTYSTWCEVDSFR